MLKNQPPIWRVTKFALYYTKEGKTRAFLLRKYRNTTDYTEKNGIHGRIIELQVKKSKDFEQLRQFRDFCTFRVFRGKQIFQKFRENWLDRCIFLQ